MTNGARLDELPHNDPCPWCASHLHNSVTCPRVRVLEFDRSGTVRRVEFHDQRVTPPYDISRIQKEACPTRQQ